RSYTAVGRRLGKSKTLMERWGKRWRWVERVAAFDTRQDQIKREAEEKVRREKAEEWERERLEMIEQHAMMGRAIRQIVSHKLSKLAQKLQGGEDVVMAQRDLTYLMVEGAKLERLARGEPTDYSVNETMADRQGRL